MAQQPPAPLGLPGGKVDAGLPEHLFLKRLQESGCFCAISLFINAGDTADIFPAHVGELWS